MTHDRFATFSGRVCSAAPRLPLLVMPKAPAVAAKYTHQGFANSGTNADIWPLSPKDWSPG